jgi:hypothetical protein
MTISIFDNGSDGYANVLPNITQPYSSGMIININAATKVAILLKQYIIPDGGVLSTSQGTTQVMDYKNVYMGWGAQPFVSEFTLDGNCVMLAQFGTNVSILAMSYRSFKIPSEAWLGSPDSTPALWTYANATSGPTVFYTSWNGATEVTKWHFFGAANENAAMLSQLRGKGLLELSLGRGGGQCTSEDDVAALDVRAHVGEPERLDELAQRRHRDAVPAADVDGAQQSDVAGHAPDSIASYRSPGRRPRSRRASWACHLASG